MPRGRTRRQSSVEDSHSARPAEMLSQESVAAMLEVLQRTQVEAFERLLERVPTDFTVPSSSSPNPVEGKGNLSRCSARYSGALYESIEGFIDAVESFKDCAQVSDAAALRGFSMLLTDTAATWWQGVKNQIKSWPDLVHNLQSAFGDRRPPHRIYRELFATIQEEENTDIFVSKARALLARLPRGDLNEKVELDMIYGLLHPRIRSRLRRDEVTSFEMLLEKSRMIEDSTKEESVRLPPPPPVARALRAAHSKSPLPPPPQVPACSNAPPAGVISESRKKLSCVYCKCYGHTRDQCRKLSSAKNTKFNKPASCNNKVIACYGCGEAGVTRAECQKCSSQFYALNCELVPRCPTAVTGSKALSNINQRPILHIEILGCRGRALIDTAAKRCVAGCSLYMLLQQRNQAFQSSAMRVKLADGSSQTREVLTTQLDVKIKTAILDEEYAEKQLNKMEKQTNKLEGSLKKEGQAEGPQYEVKRQHEWFQTPREKREEKERLALTLHPNKVKQKSKAKKRKHEDSDDDIERSNKKKKHTKAKPRDTAEERVNREMEKVALLQSRVAKRNKKQRRIRAVDDNDDRPANRQANKQAKKHKKKQSNFATDLTDTGRSATKRLRYEANKVQKGKGPFKGKGPGKDKGKRLDKGKRMDKGKAAGRGKGKSFGKPQTPKQGKKRK